jgi:predicted metal-dependent hydrolase
MPAVDPRFKKGLKLFNEGNFFECHDVIEELWLETPPDDPHRNLYKGVIQAAAAIYQFKRGILSGAMGLYKSSTGYLSRYLPSALGLDVQRFIQEMDFCFSTLTSGKKAKFSPAIAPKVKYSKTNKH